jgi:hypothetical protein
MADTDQTFVTTVADNMRQYTKREVTQAKNARELMARAVLDTHRRRRLSICSMLVCPTVMSQSKMSAMPTLSSDHAYHRSKARHTSVHRPQPRQCLLLVSHKCSRSLLWISSSSRSFRSCLENWCHLDSPCVYQRRIGLLQ